MSGQADQTADVAIIGCGLVGSVAARVLAAAGARVLLVDAGTPMSATVGTHLRNLPASKLDHGFYRELVRAQLRPAAGTRTSRGLPAARLTTILGGMGTVWNCVAMRMNPVEQWPGIAPPEWDRLYRRAEQSLAVVPELAAPAGRQEFLLRTLAGVPASPAPIAAQPRFGPLYGPLWTGPAEILAGTGDLIEVLPGHAVRRLLHRRGRVVAVEAVALDTGHGRTLRADTVMVAAGALRSPALLWSSGIGTAMGEGSALGRYLCDHPVSYARVVLDRDLLDEPEARDDTHVVIPMSPSRPFHALMLCDAYDDGLLGSDVDERQILSLYWYTADRPRFENRVVFDERRCGSFGLPRPAFEYALNAEDQARRAVARHHLGATGERLGSFLRSAPPQDLSPGSSMHIMGTTRMGTDDHDSVVDAWGRVWGFDNLYLAGTGVIPGATATNPTLTACALAVRSADAMGGAG
jgi:choline dehydrogenase-like flavoprotein